MKMCLDDYLYIITSFQQKNDTKMGNNLSLINLKFVELMSASCLVGDLLIYRTTVVVNFVNPVKFVTCILWQQY